MQLLQGVSWKQHLRPRAVVGYGVKIFLPSSPNYVTRFTWVKSTVLRSFRSPSSSPYRKVATMKLTYYSLILVIVPGKIT